MSEWQDISTAPKDGTEIEVLGNFKSRTAYYEPDCEVWFGDEFCPGTHELCLECNKCDHYIHPTHWRYITNNRS